jgi:hypothetical protein
MNKTAATILFLMGVVAFQSSCGTARKQDCDKCLKAARDCGSDSQKVWVQNNDGPYKENFVGRQAGSGYPGFGEDAGTHKFGFGQQGRHGHCHHWTHRTMTSTPDFRTLAVAR